MNRNFSNHIIPAAIVTCALILVAFGLFCTDGLATEATPDAIPPLTIATDDIMARLPKGTIAERAERDQRLADAIRKDQERLKSFYPFGVCGTNFRHVPRGEYFPQLEMLAFSLQDKNGQLWLVNLDGDVGGVKETKSAPTYQVLKLRNACVRYLDDFVSLPRRCVSREDYRTWGQIKGWLGSALKPDQYSQLIPQVDSRLNKSVTVPQKRTEQ